MESINFAYWLQGFFEISNDKKLNEKQVQIIKDHLALVFDKQTPDRNIDINDVNYIKKVAEDSLNITPQRKQELMFSPINPSTVNLDNIPNTFTTNRPKGVCSSGHRNNGKSTVYC